MGSGVPRGKEMELIVMPKFIRTYADDNIEKKTYDIITQMLSDWFKRIFFEFYLCLDSDKVKSQDGIKGTKTDYMLDMNTMVRTRKNFMAFVERME